MINAIHLNRRIQLAVITAAQLTDGVIMNNWPSIRSLNVTISASVTILQCKGSEAEEKDPNDEWMAGNRDSTQALESTSKIDRDCVCVCVCVCAYVTEQKQLIEVHRQDKEDWS